MPRKGSPYGPVYERARSRLQRAVVPCTLAVPGVCTGRATSLDHQPPVAAFPPGQWQGRLVPVCLPCNTHTGGSVRRSQFPGAGMRSSPAQGASGAPLDEPAEVVEPVGFDAGSDVWRVDWLTELVDGMPDDAVWPRLMTIPHPDAVGSLGAEFEWWCRTYRRTELRWWQRLVARRLLEVDAEGRLVWLVLILTLARQLGKSWLLQLILAWRLHQGGRFGVPQRLLHMSIQMSQVRDVMAREIGVTELSPLYATLDNNNDTSIEWLEDGSKWVRVVKGTRRGGGAYGQSGVAVAVVDEAWSIGASVIDDGLEPTIVEGVQPWLMLISTAHRMATALMLDRRAAALDELDTGAGALIVEWSAPSHFDLTDVAGWRLASPHWTRQREQLIRGAVQRALSGVAVQDDPDEPDPVESVRAQWLNQWPAKLTVTGRDEALLGTGLWADLTVAGDETPRRVWVAVADNFGRGAAVCAVAEIGGDRFEVDGWLVADRDAALVSARATIDALGVHGELVVEPALGTAAPIGATVATPADVRFGLPLLRQLVDAGRLVHDATAELDGQLAECRVRAVSGGLTLSTGARSDLVRAAALALRAAVVHKPLPAIHIPRKVPSPA